MTKQEENQERPKEEFLNKKTSTTEALKRADKLRQSENDLYWHRAAYFWIFIGVTFTGYFALCASDNKVYTAKIVVSCLGLIFSYTWYLANRGSKYWLSIRDRAVDIIEDSLQQPIFKTHIIYTKEDFFKLLTPYPFSLTNLNALLNIYVILVWIFLVYLSAKDAHLGLQGNLAPEGIIIIITIIFIIIIPAFSGRHIIKNGTEFTYKIPKYK